LRRAAFVVLLGVACGTSPPDAGDGGPPDAAPTDGGGGDAGDGGVVPTSVIPADRRIDWSPGRAIPAYPTTKTACNSGCDFTTHGDDASDDSGVIESCLQALSAGQACLVKAGTYAIAQKITLGSGVVLRGEGPGKTVFDNRWGGGITVEIGGGSIGGASDVAVASGSDKGSTSLVLASAPSFASGSYLAVTEDPDTSLVNLTGVDGTCTWCGGPWQKGAGTQPMGQIVRVTGVSGDTVTIDRPLYFTFPSSLSPVVLPLTNMTEDSGVEDLTIHETASGAGENNGLVHIYGCAGCWAKGVEASGAYAEFVELQFSRGCVVRDSYLHDPQTADSGRGYGVHVLDWNSDHLIENNVMVKNRHSVAFEGGGSGVVVAYNFMYRDWESDSDPQWLGDDLITHGAHPYMNLLEGNVHQQLALDDIWGSSSHMTYFRNNPTATGDYQTTATENNVSVVVAADNRYANVVGNVFGTASLQGPTSYDSAVASTLLTCGDAYFGGGSPIDGACSDALPPSLYLGSAPSWFSTPYGTVPWPPIGPDVTGSVHAIPAELCYENTVAKGADFAPSACYGN
jgi:hypothetical protein